MDIESLITAETAECKITDAQGCATDVVITLHGVNSQKYREAFHRKSKDLNKESTGEDIFSVECRMLAELTESWKNVKMGGKELPLTVENAEMVYRKSAVVRNQVSAFIYRIEHFLPSA